MAKLGEWSAVVVDAEQGSAVDLPPPFEKLKPGPGLPAEQVLADQRRRLQGATIAVVNASGCRNVRVRALAQTAGVSTATFYKHFLNADDCLASTHDSVMTRVLRRCSLAQGRQTDWHEALRAVVSTFFESLAEDPMAARFVLVEVFEGGSSARKRIGQMVYELEQLVSTSFTDAPRTVAPPRHLVAGMTGGLLRIARTTILAGRADELPGLADEVGDWLLSLPSPEVLSLLAATSDKEARERACREVPPSPTPEVRSIGAHVSLDDRERFLRAALKLAATEGFASLSVPRLRSEAGVSGRRFDAIFGSVDECFLESVERVVGTHVASAAQRSASAADWRQRTCGVASALCTQAARSRVQARLAFLAVFATGRTGLLWRERIVGRMAGELRGTVPTELKPSEIVAEASTAASWQIVQADVAARRVSGLPEVAPLLSYVVLAPIIGSRTASEAIQSRGVAKADELERSI